MFLLMTGCISQDVLEKYGIFSLVNVFFSRVAHQFGSLMFKIVLVGLQNWDGQIAQL